MQDREPFVCYARETGFYRAATIRAATRRDTALKGAAFSPTQFSLSLSSSFDESGHSAWRFGDT